MPKTEKINEDHLVIKKDSDQTYVTGVIGGSSQVDIRLLVLEKETFTDDSGNIIMRDMSKHQLIMSPPIAVNVINALQSELNKIKEKTKSREKKKDQSLD